MLKTISGLVAAVAVMTTAGAAPAMACGGGLFQSSCSPCGYTACAPVYVAPVYSGCNTGCGGWDHAALSDEGSWAPEPAYEAMPAYGDYGYGARGYGYGYGFRPGLGYGYGARYGVGRGFGYAGRYGYGGRGYGARYGMGYRGGRIGRY